jgi:hypothetical protein
MLRALYTWSLKNWLRVTSRWSPGTNIFEKEWDLLIILDACRVDMLNNMSEKYGFLSDGGTIWSVGSSTGEWLPKTFIEEYVDQIRETAYVTANPYTQAVFGSDSVEELPIGVPLTMTVYPEIAKKTVSAGDFGLLDEVWKDEWNEELGTVPPRAVTKRAIAAHRRSASERMIVHYMQPHQPFIGGDAPFGAKSIDDEQESIWQSLRAGTTSEARVLTAYEQNLGHVLDDVAILLQNVDAGIAVISSDHGNALGEQGLYDHPAGVPHPVLKRVPWVETSAEDTGEFEIKNECVDRTDDIAEDVDVRLKRLGYK